MSFNPSIWSSAVLETYKENLAMATHGPDKNFAVARMLKILIPIDVLWENVYRIDTSMKLSTDNYVLKLTFYNDQSVKLDYNWKKIGTDEVLVPEPPNDDFEAWKADALMRCEAGEDFYERPKAQAFSLVGGSSGSLTVQQGLNASYLQGLNTTTQQLSRPQYELATPPKKQGKSWLTGLVGALLP